MRRIGLYIHEHKDWTHFYWDETAVSLQLAKTKYLQGKLMGKMESLGFDLQDEALLNTLTSEIVKSSEIEGELLDLDQVRSSLAKRLGIAFAGAKTSERHIDGIVEMMLNATQNYQLAITKERLFGWHAALFPTGWSNQYKIAVANWRDDSTGPMQVVSGAMGKEKVHFQAPDSAKIPAEMKKFFMWVNSEPKIDPVLKAAIAHFWFVTIHPFEDGNGRITRAITEQIGRAHV
jgi:Fic family protein